MTIRPTERRYHVYDSLLPAGIEVPAVSFSEDAVRDIVTDRALGNEVMVPQLGRNYSIRAYRDPAADGDTLYVGGDFTGW